VSDGVNDDVGESSYGGVKGLAETWTETENGSGLSVSLKIESQVMMKYSNVESSYGSVTENGDGHENGNDFVSVNMDRFDDEISYFRAIAIEDAACLVKVARWSGHDDQIWSGVGEQTLSDADDQSCCGVDDQICGGLDDQTLSGHHDQNSYGLCDQICGGPDDLVRLNGYGLVTYPRERAFDARANGCDLATYSSQWVCDAHKSYFGLVTCSLE
jgi:hypothetical protein